MHSLSNHVLSPADAFSSVHKHLSNHVLSPADAPPTRPESSFEPRAKSRQLLPLFSPPRPKTSMDYSFHLSPPRPGESPSFSDIDSFELHPPVIPSPMRSPWVFFFERDTTAIESLFLFQVVDLMLSDRDGLARPRSPLISSLTKRENEKFSYRCSVMLGAPVSYVLKDGILQAARLVLLVHAGLFLSTIPQSPHSEKLQKNRR